MSIAATKPVEYTAPSTTQLLTPSEIDTLLDRLARGHLSTFQEEYADLKRALFVVCQG